MTNCICHITDKATGEVYEIKDAVARGELFTINDLRDVETTDISLEVKAKNQYYLGVVTNLSLEFKNGNKIGDIFYIQFTTGESVINIAPADNTVFKEYTALANSIIELCGIWNGTKWLVKFSGVNL